VGVKWKDINHEELEKRLYIHFLNYVITRVFTALFFLGKRLWNAKSDPRFGQRGGGGSYINARKKFLVYVLKKNFWDGVPVRSITKLLLGIPMMLQNQNMPKLTWPFCLTIHIII
jgi:hypothetical protein